jgi:hypothetical protein
MPIALFTSRIAVEKGFDPDNPLIIQQLTQLSLHHSAQNSTVEGMNWKKYPFAALRTGDFPQ